MGEVRIPVAELETVSRRFSEAADAMERSRLLVGAAGTRVFVHPAGPNLSAAGLSTAATVVRSRLRPAAEGFQADTQLIRETIAAALEADRVDGDRRAKSWFQGSWFDDAAGWFDPITRPLSDLIDDLNDTANQTFDRLVDHVNDGRKRLLQLDGFVWGFSVGIQELSTEAMLSLADLADDLAVTVIMAEIRRVRLAAGLLLEFSPLGPTAAVGRWAWNRHINPALVREVMTTLEPLIGHDRVAGPSAGDPGGYLTSRRLPSFKIDGNSAVERGRNAVIHGLEATATASRIRPDEFEIISHGNGRYTLVLAGVTDLSNPDQGLSPVHRSVRDIDQAAVRSAASSSVVDNRYAEYVMRYAVENVPEGAELSIIGHSFGADTAVDLAASPEFNGRRFVVTHVTAAAYHSEPQLGDVPDGTNVLVLQNNKDVPVMVEELGHASSIGQMLPPSRDNIVIREFNGGWAGAGHHQDNYIDYVATTNDPVVGAFLAGLADHGYTSVGHARSVDISVPGAEPDS
ncbi:MAG: hypothetical protein OER95_04090 [Acidimicrobiia bacterium]|nr:hypothetical protein [Acidimicrobiia bacterium]